MDENIERFPSPEEIEKLKKKAERRAKRQARKEAIKKWVVDNKAVIIGSIPVVVATTTKVVKGVKRHKNYKAEKDLKDLYIYDAHLKHYWKLKRPLTPAEWFKVHERKEKGERLEVILRDMRVLDF